MNDGASQSEQRRLLVQLRARAERLISAPESVSLPLTRLAAPLFRAFSWEPQIATEQLRELVGALARGREPINRAEGPPIAKLLDDALAELDDNLTALERAQIVRGTIPLAHSSWLLRMWNILSRAERVRSLTADSTQPFRQIDEYQLAPPLPMHSDQEAARLGAIDPLLIAAESETDQLERRRRFLLTARELLLEGAAALNLDPTAVEARQRHVARALAQLDRYQAAGLDPRVSLHYQLARASERRDVPRLHAALCALNDLALGAGNARLEQLTTHALDRLRQGRSRFDHEARADSLSRSRAEAFDARLQSAVREGFARARSSLVALRERADKGEIPANYASQSEAYLAQDNVELTLQAALAVDGCFEVGGVLSPVRVVEEERLARFVTHPTQELVLVDATGAEDLPNALIEDPRTVLLSLAAGRLLARRYAVDEVRRRERTVLASEVRVYVLDGSTSMLGARARMRDAILLSELATLIARLTSGRRITRPALHFRYFTRELAPVTKVTTVEQALDAISAALGTPRIGGTDIEQALLSSFEQVRAARAEDPELARAQIVLVTDGEAPVDLVKIQAARESVGKLPVGVSIIALGQENPALKELARLQRARGERVFYQHIPDVDLVAIAEGTAFGGAIHAPDATSDADLMRSVSELVDEIEADRRKTEVETLARAREQRAALSEVGLSLEHDLSEAERAKAEAFARDLQALERRFERWFHVSAALPEAPLNEPSPAEEHELGLLGALLESVAEVATLLGGEPLARMADSVDVLERMLLDARISPGRYADLARRYPERLRAPIEQVRKAVLCSKA